MFFADANMIYFHLYSRHFQMLSMRNSPNLHPMCLSGALHPSQVSQLCMSFGDNTSTMNLGVFGTLPLNPDSSANSSFDLKSQCTTSNQTVMIPATSISASQSSFGIESSRSQHPSFQFGVPEEEIFTADLVPREQLDSGRTAGNLSENVIKAVNIASSLNFGRRGSSSLEHHDHFTNVVSKNQAVTPIFTQDFDG
ncbi:uncharacterized protein LOC109831879 isoform X2 [Asparagus officinalis]|nr:uncharacterized protein LOC109831879 isoform X2 [Asparagus officinalis]